MAVKVKDAGYVVKIKQENGAERALGKFKESTKTLYLERRSSKHFHRKSNSWGIDVKAFEELVAQNGLQYVVIHDKDTNKKIKASAEDIQALGHYLHFKPYGLQLFLAEHYWQEA